MAGKCPSATSGHLFPTIDPESLILSQFPDAGKPHFLKLTTESLTMERGPRYKAYADLRESRLRMKSMNNPPPLPLQPQDSSSNLTPLPPQDQCLTPPKKVKFQNQGGFLPPTANRRKGSSVLAQSVPDFSSVLRKENRKPALPPVVEKSATPPAKTSSRLYEANARLEGSKSAVSGEKRGGGGLLEARKSYANMDELKKFSMATANAINGKIAGNRGGGRSTVLGVRQYF